ncbi:unnamed protein product [Caenorhabditis angaria]|uniref:Uncharacterized protein n=1 Tax=Caenorhabditis angaria TaxID=860376 RepID=A0A9P1N1D7_9PELO|nr:unnamed protein product [Caenorhabditis angaria]
MMTSQGPSTPKSGAFFTSTPVTKGKFRVFYDSEDESIEQIKALPPTPKRITKPKIAKPTSNLVPRAPTVPQTPRFARPTKSWLAKQNKPRDIQQLFDAPKRQFN